MISNRKQHLYIEMLGKPTNWFVLENPKREKTNSRKPHVFLRFIFCVRLFFNVIYDMFSCTDNGVIFISVRFLLILLSPILDLKTNHFVWQFDSIAQLAMSYECAYNNRNRNQTQNLCPCFQMKYLPIPVNRL